MGGRDQLEKATIMAMRRLVLAVAAAAAPTLLALAALTATGRLSALPALVAGLAGGAGRAGVAAAGRPRGGRRVGSALPGPVERPLGPRVEPLPAPGAGGAVVLVSL